MFKNIYDVLNLCNIVYIMTEGTILNSLGVAAP